MSRYATKAGYASGSISVKWVFALNFCLNFGVNCRDCLGTPCFFPWLWNSFFFCWYSECGQSKSQWFPLPQYLHGLAPFCSGVLPLETFQSALGCWGTMEGCSPMSPFGLLGFGGGFFATKCVLAGSSSESSDSPLALPSF